jgi:hypothetical protein
LSLAQNILTGTKSFQFRRFLTNGSERVKTGSTLAAPDVLTIRHQTEKSKTAPIADRHTVSNSVTVIDSNGLAKNVTVNVSIVGDRDPAITQAVVLAAVGATFGIFLAPDFVATGLETGVEGVDALSDILLGMS